MVSWKNRRSAAGGLGCSNSHGVEPPNLVGGLGHEFYFPFHIWDIYNNVVYGYIWDVILPIDELILFRGVEKPPTRNKENKEEVEVKKCPTDCGKLRMEWGKNCMGSL